MREDIKEILHKQYIKVHNWQVRKGVLVNLTFEEFVGLWSKARIATLEKKLDRSRKMLDAYMKNPVFKPVCGWVSREARDGGVMDKSTAKIMRAETSKRMFQNQKGDKLRPDTIAKMQKPKSAKHRAKMKAAASARWAKVRDDKARAQGEA